MKFGICGCLVMRIIKKLLDKFRKRATPVEPMDIESGFYWIQFIDNPGRQAKYGRNEFGYWSTEKQKFLLVGNKEASYHEIQLKSSKICGPIQI